MPERHSFDYAVVRIVPHVEREEFLNVGVILSSQSADFLKARFHVNTRRLYALAPELDLKEIESHLEAMRLICEGGEQAGPIGRLPRRARFDWLTAPRSTIIQTSPVHTGLCHDPDQALEQLLRKMVKTQ
ncbi:MAG TPA: DUF3037 domain-containing protein [Pyrinomonadaceae bacterium]|nr:DUF3037 domain-containing protein [Pyrinomonadaceae bacterium]